MGHFDIKFIDDFWGYKVTPITPKGKEYIKRKKGVYMKSTFIMKVNYKQFLNEIKQLN